MAIRYRCPQCRQLLSIGTRMAGRVTGCPACGHRHPVPVPEQEAPDKKSGKAAPDVSPPRKSAEPELEKISTSGRSPVPPASSTPDPPVPAAPPPAARPPIPEGPSFPIHFATDPIVEPAHPWVDVEEEDEGLVIHAVERKSDELDLIPMVDCVFLLLVFYMITASYAMQKTIEIAPPAPDKKGSVQAAASTEDLAQTSIVVQIDAHNRITVDDVLVANSSDLPNALRAKLKGDQKSELVVECDPKAFFETEVAVIDAAHELQFQRIRMATISSDAD